MLKVRPILCSLFVIQWYRLHTGIKRHVTLNLNIWKCCSSWFLRFKELLGKTVSQRDAKLVCFLLQVPSLTDHHLLHPLYLFYLHYQHRRDPHTCRSPTCRNTNLFDVPPSFVPSSSSTCVYCEHLTYLIFPYP